MPDTTPLPLPKCPRGGCPATIDHWHDGGGAALVCPRQLGRPCLSGSHGGTAARRCYAPRTESSPIKTAENPAPAVLPTVDEVADAVVQSTRDEGWSYRTVAQAALDLIAARVPVWVPVEPGTVIKPGTRWRFESGEGATLRVEEETAAIPYTCRPSSARYYIDPRTVPAEPEDPRVAVVAEWWREFSADAALDEVLPASSSRDLLARLDAEVAK